MSRKEGYLSDVSAQDKMRNRERNALAQRKKDLQDIMALPVGRRFVYDLIFDKCGIMNVYPAQDSGIYRHEGRRSLGVELGAELQSELPELWTRMIEEHLVEQRNDAVIRKAAIAAGENDG